MQRASKLVLAATVTLPIGKQGARGMLPGRQVRRATIRRGGTMRNYGIIGTLVVIILIIVVLKLLGLF